MRPRAVYKSTKAMRCVFYSLVVRNEAIGKKYPGGLTAFLGKHESMLSNQHIAVGSFMGMHDLDVIADDLQESNLRNKEDFVILDALNLFEPVGVHPMVCEGAPWLKGRYQDDGLVVWYVGDGSEASGVSGPQSEKKTSFRVIRNSNPRIPFRI